MFLAVWVLVVLVLFSISINKLPGYILPLLPAAAALMALALDEVPDARIWLAACAALLVAFPITAQMLPAGGSERTLARSASGVPGGVAGAGRRGAAGVAAGIARKTRGGRAGGGCRSGVGNRLFEERSRRRNWTVASPRAACGGEIGGRADEVCIGNVKRDWEYGLNYYSITPLPDCEKQPKPLQVLPAPGGRAYLRPAP